MPRYEFMCQTCKKAFGLTMTLSERGTAKVKCPKCKGMKIEPQFTSFMVQTTKKS
jgi:putative FmdB family regulatory protein